MFTFPNRGNTLDFFSPSGLISSQWCSVFLLLFWFALFQKVSQAGATPLPFSEKEQTNVSKHDPIISVLKNPKQRCKNVVNVRLKVSLSGLHVSDSFVYQRNTIALKRAVRFAVVCIK